jgi:hypothetical protein
MVSKPFTFERPGPEESETFRRWQWLIERYPCPRCGGKGRRPCKLCSGWRVDPAVAVPDKEGGPPPIVDFMF